LIDLEERLGIRNSDWLMSSREKFCLIGLLELIRPKNCLEFGYHRGGATHWLSKYSGSVVTVDVNEFVQNAQTDYPNVNSWNMTTEEAILEIQNKNLRFDLTIIDADHSRKAIARDLGAVLTHSEIIIMHDSSNPDCRKGMLDILSNQDSHAYNLDFVTSVMKHDGIWGGLGVAVRSDSPGAKTEFKGEFSPQFYFALHDSLLIHKKVKAISRRLGSLVIPALNRAKIKIGKFKKILKR
jgi:hypothetical protein